MKYEVKVIQEQEKKYSDGSTMDTTEELLLTFTNGDDLQTFINLVSQNGENITIEIKFIKEEV